MLSSDKITEIFFVIDEFCKNFNEAPIPPPSEIF